MKRLTWVSEDHKPYRIHGMVRDDEADQNSGLTLCCKRLLDVEFQAESAPAVELLCATCLRELAALQEAERKGSVERQLNELWTGKEMYELPGR